MEITYATMTAVTRQRRLQAMLCERRQTQQRFAAQLGISETYLSLLFAGKRCPSLRLACRLELETGIPAREWLPGATPAIADEPGPVSEDGVPAPVVPMACEDVLRSLWIALRERDAEREN